MFYIGLDVHKKTSYGVKDASGRVQSVSVRRAV